MASLAASTPTVNRLTLPLLALLGRLGQMGRLPEPFRAVLTEHVELMVAELAGSPEEADQVLADLALMIGGLSLARALGDGELSDRVLRAAKSAVV